MRIRRLRPALAYSLLTASAVAQAVQVERVEQDFNVLFRGGEYMNLYAVGTLDHRSREQVASNSEATVSKYDLKAPGRARDKYTRGLRFLMKNDFDGAVESLRKAISIYPSYVAAHSALGCAYFQLKQYEPARQEFMQAVQLDDHLSSSYLNLGRVQLALGENSPAQASMEKAYSIAPLDRNLLLALTYAQYLNHDYQDVIKTAKRVHSASQTDTPIVHYFAASSWQALHNLPEARDQLQTFLTEDPNSPLAGAAQHVLEQIRMVEESAPTAPSAMTVSEFEFSIEPPSLGQQVLQDFKEKQQIAEAEAAESTCASCELSNQPVGLETRNVPSPDSSVHTPNHFPWALRSRVDEVGILFSATENGRSVNDLDPNDVTILDDHKPPAAVLSFQRESDLPLRLGLLIDASASIKERFSFERNAATNFMNQILTGKDDLAFVTGFSNSVVLAQDFTSDQNQLAHGMSELVPVGGTAIWDAVAFAADKLASRQEGHPVARILVLISDGDDNSSTATLKQAIERAELDDVIVYTVSTRYKDAESQRNDPTGNRAMKTLAQLTGGVSFFPGSAGHLSRSLGELEQVIRSRYFISYRPALFRPDGHYRSIVIVAKKSGRTLKVNARKGYYSDNQSADSGKH